MKKIRKVRCINQTPLLWKLTKPQTARSEATLAKSFSTLQVKKFDLEFTVDPLFKKTCADFDEGGAMGLLMNHLGVDGKGRVVFDAGDAGADVEEEEGIEEEEDEMVDLTKLRSEHKLCNLTSRLTSFQRSCPPWPKRCLWRFPIRFQPSSSPRIPIACLTLPPSSGSKTILKVRAPNWTISTRQARLTTSLVTRTLTLEEAWAAVVSTTAPPWAAMTIKQRDSPVRVGMEVDWPWSVLAKVTARSTRGDRAENWSWHSCRGKMRMGCLITLTKALANLGLGLSIGS